MAVVKGTKFQVNDEIYYIDKRLDLRKSIVKNVELICYGGPDSILEYYIFKDGSRIYKDRCYKNYKHFFEEVKHNFNKKIDKELDKLSETDGASRNAIGLSEIIKIMIKE